MKSSVSARLTEKDDRRRGMTLDELKVFVEQCDENGLPGHATLRTNVGLRGQLVEIIGSVDESELRDWTAPLETRIPRTWVLAGSMSEARHELKARDIEHRRSLRTGAVRAFTPLSGRSVLNAKIQAGDWFLQLPGAPESTIALFEKALVAQGLTYASLEILL
ncbi:hypothetical protein ASD11_01360 [Aeromicrobium sp. Root495]|uniref:hypothetical protein n=1 Tax=Aeromicrobium sp. Root495 TaxID=1736550 RepID=UPI0006F202A9|nr:hypothetical protein [Aeromicrobium sp. Root495]KQY58343.1 hypothetical protein ASD11_01360 [Aeromicrobium sp. Root495]